LESAYQRKAPILLWIYAPHWSTTKYKGEWVEFPEYTKACYEDPSWGINPDMAYDCGKPHGEIWKVGWVGVKDKWPDAYKAIKAFTIDNDEMGQMITKVDLDGQKVDDVVAEWMGANEARWSQWIKK
jgi:glycine betaine/proline transport system substrate-binding protein